MDRSVTFLALAMALTPLITVCEGAGRVVWSKDDCDDAGYQMVVLDWGRTIVTNYDHAMQVNSSMTVFSALDGNNTSPFFYPYGVMLVPAASLEYFVATSGYNTPHPPYQTHITYAQLSSTRIVSNITFIVPHDETPGAIPIKGGVLAKPVHPKPGTTHLYWAFGSDALLPLAAHPTDSPGYWDLMAVGPDRQDFLFAMGNTTLCLYNFPQNRQTVVPTAMGWEYSNDYLVHNKRFAVGRLVAVHAVPVISSRSAISRQWNLQRVSLHGTQPASFNKTLYLPAIGYVPPPRVKTNFLELSTDVTLSDDDSVIYLRSLLVCDLVPLGGECYQSGTFQHLRVTALDSQTLEPIHSDSLNCLNYSTAYPGKAFTLAEGGLGMVMFRLPEGEVGTLHVQLYTFRGGKLQAEPGNVDLGYSDGDNTPYNPMTVSIPFATEVVKVAKGKVSVAFAADGSYHGHVQLVEFTY